MPDARSNARMLNASLHSAIRVANATFGEDTNDPPLQESSTFIADK